MFWLWGIAIMNVADALNTIWLLRRPGMYETNPLMRWAIGVSPVFFFVLKMLLVGVSVVALWWARNTCPRLSCWAARVMFGIYVLIILVQIRFWLDANPICTQKFCI